LDFGRATLDYFASRVRMLSESPRLGEALEILLHEHPDDVHVKAALAAARANRHAARQEWQSAVEQFDVLRQSVNIAPEVSVGNALRGVPGPANGQSSGGPAERHRGRSLQRAVDYFRTPGLLRLATALFHQDRPAEAALLLAAGEERRAEDGTWSVDFGIAFHAGDGKATKVFHGSPAWRAGLREGDRILKLNDVEAAAENTLKLSALLAGDEPVRFTVEHPGGEAPQTVELTKAGYLQDDVANLLSEELLAAVDQKLAESLRHPGLLELRAELAGLSSDHPRQVAGYTAAIEALSVGNGLRAVPPRENAADDRPVAEFVRIPADDVQRLHCRRGNAYLGLKQWRQAVEDYAQGITNETTDDDLLAHQAVAQANVMTPEAFVQLGREGESHGIQLVDFRGDGVTEPATKNGHDCRMIGPTGNGSKYAYFAIDTELKWSESKRAEVEIEYFDDASGAFRVQYDAHENAYQEADKPVQRTGSEEWRTARFALAGARFANTQNGGADFRIENLYGVPLYFKRVTIRRSFPGSESDNPWVRLAAAYRIASNDQAIDELVERRPQAAGAIGDLFAADNRWQRAIDIYSQGLSWGGLPRPSAPNDGLGRPPHGLDAELLSRRARAYEQLSDWNAAAADWQRAASQDPEAAKLLTDFAERLLKVAPALRDGDRAGAERRQLATSVRGRAQKLLEATLDADPGDDPATAALAALLLDKSDPDLHWTALRPAELKTASGAALRLGDDDSIAVEPGTDTVTLPDAGHSLGAVRIETSPDANGVPFKEYQIVSTRLPAEGFFGQYVRIDLPGDSKQFPRKRETGDFKILSLAEVQVFDGEKNLARSGRASQSTTGYGGAPERAVDGNTSGDWSAGSVTHTEEGKDLHPCWELDLGMKHGFDRIVVWNRTDGDGDLGTRLNHFRVRILDASRNVVFEQVIDRAPDPWLEITRRARLVRIEGGAAEGTGQWQLRLDTAGGLSPWKRLRLWVTDDQPVLPPSQLEASDVTWTMPLAIPDSAKAVRVETAADEYRMQALGAPLSESGAPLGRYVRIDLPGGNKQFPRGLYDGERKMLNLAELQVFQGERNIAAGKKARQSSTSGDAVAGRAVDGNTDSSAAANSSADTDAAKDGSNPWWEVDLGGQQAIDRVGVWNRVQNPRRMNHFRVRILDDSRHIVFEQVIDKAPNPSKEILCQSLLVPFLAEEPRPAETSAAAAETSVGNALRGVPRATKRRQLATPGTPQRTFPTVERPAENAGKPKWSLRLGAATGVVPGVRFRVSTADQVDAVERSDTIAEARAIARPAGRLAAAFAIAGDEATAALWLGRSLDGADSNVARASLVESLQGFPKLLASALASRPDDAPLQLALARAHARQGGEELDRGHPAEALARLGQARREFDEFLASHPGPRWLVLQPREMQSAGGATLTGLDDGSILADGANPDRDVYTLFAKTDLERITALRLEALPDVSLPYSGPGRFPDNGNFHLNELRLSSGGRSAALTDIVVDYDESGQVRSVIDGSVDFARGWSNYPKAGQANTAVIAARLRRAADNDLKIEMYFSTADVAKHGLGRFRLSVTDDADPLGQQRLRMGFRPRDLAELDLAIGKAHAQQGHVDEAAAAFARSLDRIEEDDARKDYSGRNADNRGDAAKQFIAQFQDDQAVLAALARKRPHDLRLQIALAENLAESGKQALAEGREEESLAIVAQAGDVFTRLVAEHPEPQWTVPRPIEMKSEGGADLTLQQDGSVLASGTDPDHDSYTLILGDLPATVTAFRLETLSDASLPHGGPGRAPDGTFVLSRISLLDGRNSLPWAAALADFSQPGFGVSYAILPHSQTHLSGWANGGAPMRTPTALFALREPWTRQPGSTAAVRLDFHYELANRTLGRFRLSVTDDANVLESARFQREFKASGLADLALSLAAAHARQGRLDEAAAAFVQAFDLAGDREGRAKVLNEASAYEGALDKMADSPGLYTDPHKPEAQARSGDELASLALRVGVRAAFADALARHFHVRGDLAKARAAADKARAFYERQLQAQPANSRLAKDLADLLLDVNPVEWTILRPTDMKSQGGATLTLQPDGSILAGGVNPDRDVYTLVAKTDLDRITAMRLEALPDASLPNNGPGRCPGNGNFHLHGLRVFSGGAPVALTNIVVRYDEFHEAGRMIERINSGTWGNARMAGQTNTAVIATRLERAPDDDLKVELYFSARQHGLGRFRLSLSGDPSAFDLEEPRLAALKVTDPWVRLGACYRALGELDKALAAMARAIEMAADDTAKAAAAREAAAFDDVFPQLLERFADTNPKRERGDDKPLRLGQAKYLASKHIEQNEFQAAVDRLSGALENVPDDIELLNTRAAAQVKLGQWPAAEADYTRLIELDPDDGRRREAQRARAEIQIRLGHFDQGAETLLDEMFLSPNDFWRIRDAAAAQLLGGNPLAARSAADRLWRQAPAASGPAVAEWLVRILAAQPGMITGANRQRLLDAAKRVEARWSEAMTAAVHYRLGDLNEAEALVTKSADDRQLQALAAMLLYDQGKVEEARKVLGQVTRWLEERRAQDPGSPIPVQQVWQSWAVTTAVWREAARKLIGPRIAELDASLNKVKIEIVRAEYGVAGTRQDVTEALRKQLANAQLVSSPSAAFLSLRLPSYNAVFGEPKPYTVKQLKVECRLNGARGVATFSEDSLIAFPVPDASLKYEPADAKLLVERAHLLADAGLYDEALNDLERLASLRVDSPDADAVRGRVLAALNRTDEALKLLNQAVEAGVQDAGVYAARGKILFDRGQTSQARADLERSLELAPTASAARSLARVLVDEASKGTWTVLKPLEMKSEGGATLTIEPDGSVLAGGINPDRDVYTITAKTDLEHIAAIRLEALADASLPRHGPGRFPDNGNFHLNKMRVFSAGAAVKLTDIIVGYNENQRVRGVTDGNFDAIGGWSNHPKAGQNNTALMATRIDRAADDELKIEMYFSRSGFTGHNLGRFRLSVSPDANAFARQDLFLAALLASERGAVAVAQLRTAHAELAPVFAAAGQWQAGAEAQRSAITLRPDDTFAWLRAAPYLVLSGDEAGYREFCRDMTRQFRGNDDAVVADRVCKACLLRPGMVDLAEVPVERLRQVAADSPPGGNGAFFRACCALVSYRAGNFQQAITWAEQVDEQNAQARVLALVVRSMAEQQLGQAEQARQTLAQASALIPTELATLGSDAHRGPLPVAVETISHDWLIPEILRREANVLIGTPPGSTSGAHGRWKKPTKGLRNKNWSGHRAGSDCVLSRRKPLPAVAHLRC